MSARRSPVHSRTARGLARGDELLDLLLHCRAEVSRAPGHGPRGWTAAPATSAAARLRAELLRDALRSGVAHADAEDVVHDTLEQLLCVSLDAWHSSGAIVPTIARRRVIDRRRQRRREALYFHPLDGASVCVE